MTAPNDLYELREALMSALDSINHRRFDATIWQADVRTMLERELTHVDEEIGKLEKARGHG